jgi:DNA helicase-2/ATP-dependent DNA helicase PcrA
MLKFASSNAGMINRNEQEEREYLEGVKEKLQFALRRVGDTVTQFDRELREKKEYIYEHQSGMDDADRVAAEQSVNRMVFTGDTVVARRRKLQKLLLSPYFGRIDFSRGDAEPEPVYIGIFSFAGETSNRLLINDWRAPVASMFYDFELGEAFYETPSGRINGRIALKRQYRIRDGRMEFMIENEVNIQDDLLQRELSKSSDDKMKTIVATIQRDQNAVIRNETANVMIIQGVAGSGKTSIALHRIAFLLYRFRDTLAAKDILILSPNKVFADYISNVLPELGEEYIPQIGMEELASDLLDRKFPFQNFFQQVEALAADEQTDFVERIRYKASFEFLSLLNRYFIHLENTCFAPTAELHIAGVVVPFPFILERFLSYHRLPFFRRMPEVVREVLNYVRARTNRKLTGQERAYASQQVPALFTVTSTMDVYRNFFSWANKPAIFRWENGILEYADVFPLIYCRIRLEGVKSYDHVKHLLVDEMQDYTPVQYAVLSRVFPCRKTILGDVGQTFNPYSASSAESIERIFPQADVVKLYRSYRSTKEITAFAQAILENAGIIALERHGPPPTVRGFASNPEEAAEIVGLIADFRKTEHRSMGIICKTQAQANYLWGQLKGTGAHLLTDESTRFPDGIMVTTVHLAKGLEFDEVIVPFVSAGNYRTEFDRRLLYIACTRAMHELHLLFTKEMSPLIKI